MGVYVFPTRLFRPASLKPYLMGSALSGGRSLSGDAQFADLSGGGRWCVEFGESTLWRPAKVKAWRALAAAADGGATPILVPLADRRHQPFIDPQLTTPDAFGLSIWDDGATPWAPVEIVAELTADADLRATEVTFSYSGGVAIEGGEHFSVEHPEWGWRLYRITRVVADEGGEVTVQFRPPLREAAAIGTALNFETPRCLMRADGDFDLTLDMLKFGRGAVRFVELPHPLALESES